MKKIDREPIVEFLDLDDLDLSDLLNEILINSKQFNSLTAFAYNDYAPGNDNDCTRCQNGTDYTNYGDYSD